MENKYGRVSKLNIKIKSNKGKTLLDDLYFTPPFKIMKPFYEEDIMKLILMSASPGIMEGDCQKITIEAEIETKAEISSQSFEKIHKMTDGSAKRKIDINIKNNAFLSFSPQPTIPYENSAFSNEINVKLEDNSSSFIYEDILICGRASLKEHFKYKYYNSFINIYEKNKLSYRDNTRFEPEKINMKSIGMYEGYTHLLSMVLCNINIEDSISDIFKDFNYPYGFSKNHKGYIVIKALAYSAEILQNIADVIKKESYIAYKNNKIN